MTYGNFDAITVKGDVTGPISETVAFSIGGSYNRRDGYAQDLKLDTDVNDRNRWGVRGQLLFEPTDALSIRLIADYTSRDEECCAATYIDSSVNPYIGNLNNPSTPLACRRA